MQINVNGIEVDAKYTTSTIQNILLPLLEKLTNLQKEEGRRIIVFLAAPPGCGKSTLSLYLEYLSKTSNTYTTIQAIGMDGFHHTNVYLNNHYRNDTNDLLALHKGAPDTFNIESLKQHLIDIKEKEISYWPIYDRTIHDPIDNAITVKEKIILIEGNYLLLNKDKWKDLKEYSDYNIFVYGEPINLEKRLVDRKMHSGSPFDIALKHYHETDKPNILLVNKFTLPSDLCLKLVIKENDEVELIHSKVTNDITSTL